MQFRDLPADKRVLLEHFDGFAGVRNALKSIGERTGEWAGIPMPLEGQQLVIEPTYPKAAEISKIGAPVCREEIGEGAVVDGDGRCRRCGAGSGEACYEQYEVGVEVRNRFWSDRLMSTITIWKKDGKIQWGKSPGIHHFSYDLQALGCSDVWGIEQEHNAMNLLGTLVSHRQMKQFLLTGMFLETSTRSGLTYMFRRLKPTVVIDARVGKDIRIGFSQKKHDGCRILTTLCLHPIAYYAGSWAGAMTPTDDVVAHLMLMRGDEVMFWRRSNQHDAIRPESGL